MLLSHFDLAFDVTLWFEGGYSPNGPGGPTKYGISKAEYPDLNIAKLTVAKARWIYYRDYWTSISLDQLTSLIVATKMFDTGVNHGLVTAVEILQVILGVKVDGVLGPVTAAAANKMQEGVLVENLRQATWAKHKELVDRRPVIYSKYADGWRRRDGWPYDGPGRAWPYLPRTGETWKLTEA